MDDGRLEGYRLIHIRDNIAKATLFIVGRDCQEIIAPENRCKTWIFLIVASLSDSLIS